MNIAVRKLGTALIILGLVTFAAGPLVIWLGDRIPRDVEFPLGYPEAIAVDREGRIYCGVQFYSHVQVYSPTGRFLASRYVNAFRGTFRLGVNSEDQLVVATMRGRKLHIFDRNLDLLSTSQDWENLYAIFDEARVSHYDERKHVRYELRNFLLIYPHIVKTDRSGESTVVVRAPFSHWVVMGPFPALGYVILGIFLRTRYR